MFEQKTSSGSGKISSSDIIAGNVVKAASQDDIVENAASSIYYSLQDYDLNTQNRILARSISILANERSQRAANLDFDATNLKEANIELEKFITSL